MLQQYKVQIIPKNEHDENIIHTFVNNVIAQPLEFNVGEPGWFVYKNIFDTDIPWHRIKTSNVQKVEYEGKNILVETENSTYKFVAKKAEKLKN